MASSGAARRRCDGGSHGGRCCWSPKPGAAVAAIALAVALCARTEGVNFTAAEYKILLSKAVLEPQVAPIGRLYALSELGSAAAIEYSLSGNDFFRVNRSNGWIYVNRTKVPPDSGKVRVTARARDANGIDGHTATASVVVEWTELGPACSAADARRLCFASPSVVTLVVPESVTDRPHAIAYLPPGEPGVTACIANYTVLGGEISKRHLFVNASTAELYLRGADREAVLKLDATVHCELVDGRTANMSIEVQLLDINDNGPSWDFHRLLHYREETVRIYADRLRKPLTNTPVLNSQGAPMKFYVRDLDSANAYRVYLLQDKYSQFKVSSIRKMNGNIVGEILGVELFWNQELVLNASTSIEIAFVDYRVMDNKGALENKTATVLVNFELFDRDELDGLQLLPTYNVTVHRNASRWSRVLGFDGFDHTGLVFRLEFPESQSDPYCSKAFSITRDHGIVYVTSPADLHLCSLDALVSTISIEQRNRTRKVELHIALLYGALPDEPPEEISCSNIENAEECGSTIGLGAPLGYCTWQAINVTSRAVVNSTDILIQGTYTTCSPSAATCPNRRCDDLELLIPTLCPQDCTTEVWGNAHKAGGYRGVKFCVGVLSCRLKTDLMDADCHMQKACPQDTTASTTCYCSDDDSDTTDYDGISHELESTIAPAMTHHSSVSTSALVCGKDCEAVIIAAVAFIAIVVTSLAIWCRVHVAKERAKRAAASYRPWRVDSSMSLPSMVYATSGTAGAVATPANNVSAISNWQSHLAYYNIPVDLHDPKWELPRESIILEKNLGEGEFGMVMKARVKRKGSDGVWCTAAVKMLKDGATSSEFADLLSEYKLLKEVNHNNVIKLIGAATRNGPFFVVVEYCEYGSLKSYLHDLRTSGQLQAGSAAEVNSTSAAELLSFCWQIAKGMQYLSEVKLVHRDLAARNILIATGKVVKISDFGLTRDVYEADAYEKKSHGRIPVKWMAPESLYHQVYTSKSDVWSFGVVLWEIATLGATPYPGIPPERMYRLLHEGYRMDKPETCSSRLYMLMRQCWEADPANRPTFLDLRQQLESMIEERVDYLHLTAAAAVRVCSMSSDDDSCGGGGTDSQPDSPSQALIPPPFSEKSGALEDYLMPGRPQAVPKYPPALFLKYIELQHQDE